MNDPEIIEKLEEIKEGLSKINMQLTGIRIGIGVVIGVVSFFIAMRF